VKKPRNENPENGNGAGTWYYCPLVLAGNIRSENIIDSMQKLSDANGENFPIGKK